MKKDNIKKEICESLEPCKYTKEQIIEKLLDADFENFSYIRREENAYLDYILRNGHKGYNKMSIGQLKSQFLNRFDEQI